MSSCQNGDPKVNGRWTKAEHSKFLIGLQLHGKNWKKIEEIIGTRNGSQIRSHAQKFFLKVKKTSGESENSGCHLDNSEDVENHTINSNFCLENQENQENRFESSFFMERMQKVQQQSIKPSFDLPCFDFWSQFIDVKKVAEIPDSSERKDSFVTCQGFDSKQETPISQIMFQAELAL